MDCRRFISALALSLSATAASETTWHLVDVASVVCDGDGGRAQVEISLDAFPVDQRGDPHIVSFLRTSTQAVSLDFIVTDSSTPNRTLTAQNVTLQDLGATHGRKLTSGLEKSTPSEAEDLDEVSEYEDQEEADWMEEAAGHVVDVNEESNAEQGSDDESSEPAGRFLSTGGTRRRSFGSSPRRRTSSPSSPPFSSPRRRSASTPHSVPASPSRRRTAAPARDWNPQKPNAGSYGYPSATAKNSNFGNRPPVTTGYGYSGAGAYKKNSGAKLALAAGAGVLAGVGASYAYQRLHAWMKTWSHTCIAAGKQYQSCAQCRLEHKPASECTTQISPTVDLARDDIMTSEFVLSNVTGPLTIIFTSLVGEGFTAASLCVPSNATSADNATGNASVVGNSTATAGHPQVLLVGITRLVSKASSSAAAAAAEPGFDAKKSSVVHFAVLAILGGCCCAGCVLIAMLWKKFCAGSSKDDAGVSQYPMPGGQYPSHMQPQVAPQWQQQPYTPQQPHGAHNFGQFRPGMPVAVQVPPSQYA